MAAPDTIPVTVIGGYLGSGKTTLVNHLLRHAGGRKLAVLVNDFGALPIDADLIEAERADVISIAGGCVCCTFGSDLFAALDQLYKSRPEITDVLIESSGVGLPSSIAGSVALMPHYRVGGVVVLCDATTALELCADKYLSDTIIAQLEGADLILLNKIDLVSINRRDQVAAWLRSVSRTSHILRTSEGHVPAEAILDMVDVTTCSLPGEVAHDTSIYRTTHVLIPNRVRASDLAQALTQPELRLLRAKGILRDQSGDIVQLHVAGPRWTVMSCAGNAAYSGHLVGIGLRSGADQQSIEYLVGQHIDKPS